MELYQSAHTSTAVVRERRTTATTAKTPAAGGVDGDDLRQRTAIFDEAAAEVGTTGTTDEDNKYTQLILQGFVLFFGILYIYCYIQISLMKTKVIVITLSSVLKELHFIFNFFFAKCVNASFVVSSETHYIHTL